MNKFYDIHMHAFDLSHPNLLALLNRIFNNFFTEEKNSTNLQIEQFEHPGKIKSFKNMLSILENDIGSQFLILEHFLKNDYDIYFGDKVNLNDHKYDKIVLCPLMMDFGYKDMQKGNYFYNLVPQKPIVKQTVDLFNGIKKYYTSYLTETNNKVSIEETDIIDTKNKLFEIYPFMGINTKNYTLEKIKIMLDKYFRGYKGLTESFYYNLGVFDSDIENLGNHFFAGIKLYPPLDFIPWPDDSDERKKASYLYDYCAQKSIPITVHCAEGGFFYDSNTYSNPVNWTEVLKRYPVRINFAHFGMQNDVFFIHKREWQEKVIELLLNYKNTYTDISYNGVKPEYYKRLMEIITRYPEIKEKILFGSDFMVNLMDINSYDQYLLYYSRTNELISELKNQFCTDNPKKFLNVIE